VVVRIKLILRANSDHTGDLSDTNVYLNVSCYSPKEKNKLPNKNTLRHASPSACLGFLSSRAAALTTVASRNVFMFGTRGRNRTYNNRVKVWCVTTTLLGNIRSTTSANLSRRPFKTESQIFKDLEVSGRCHSTRTLIIHQVTIKVNNFLKDPTSRRVIREDTKVSNKALILHQTRIKVNT
jgi:hypothetical protein